MSQLARDVFLWGPMGAGKSTVGAALAAETGAPFVDLDRWVEQRAGRTVGALFEHGGELSFRRAERDALEEILRESDTGRPRVVSLGGGALLDRGLRLSVLERATLVVLTASPEVSLVRMNVSRETRPLLAGQDDLTAASTLRRLMTDRANAYAEAHLTYDTSSLSVDQVIAALLPRLGVPHVLVAAGAKTYPVVVAEGTAELHGGLPVRGASGTLVVTDENVSALAAFGEVRARLARAGSASPVVLAAGERHKTVAGVQPIWDALLAHGADRSTVLVGVGGGVVTDMTGFAASTWHRGVRWMAVPTTLLGMVDASVGGKTGVDLGPAKNALGAFHPPLAVHASVAWLETEPARSFASGQAELLKTALLARPDVLAEMIERPVAFAERDPARLVRAVTAAAAAKAAIVSRDPEERGERAVLNLGHTLGHALESAGGYERFTHGEAVGLGLLAALRVGGALGITENADALAADVARVLSAFGLPTTLTDVDVRAALPLLGLDKKRKGQTLRFITVVRPGVPRMIDLPLSELQTLYDRHGAG